MYEGTSGLETGYTVTMTVARTRKRLSKRANFEK